MTLAPETQLGRYEIRSLKDVAIEGKGYEERDFRMTLLSVSPEFDGLRADPRFHELVRRIGLPE